MLDQNIFFFLNYAQKSTSYVDIFFPLTFIKNIIIGMPIN